MPQQRRSTIQSTTSDRTQNVRSPKTWSRLLDIREQARVEHRRGFLVTDSARQGSTGGEPGDGVSERRVGCPRAGGIEAVARWRRCTSEKSNSKREALTFKRGWYRRLQKRGSSDGQRGNWKTGVYSNYMAAVSQLRRRQR
ncbi:hypothetical protein MTO96_002105 [Rhipicephalus appendiculatus]